MLGLIAVGALAIYALYFYALVKLIPVVLTLPGIAGLILGWGSRPTPTSSSSNASRKR